MTLKLLGPYDSQWYGGHDCDVCGRNSQWNERGGYKRAFFTGDGGEETLPTGWVTIGLGKHACPACQEKRP